MSCGIELELVHVEDFVVVGVKHKVGHAGGEGIPVWQAEEGVVDGDGDVGRRAEIGVSVAVELLDGVVVETRAKRFVDEFDGRHGRMSGVIGLDFLEGGVRLGDCVALLPVDGAATTGIVKAVL